MDDKDNRSTHLRTKYVFVDTQALRKARFDWTGRTLSKLAEFAARGQLSLLVTEVIIGEVKSQLAELLAEANNAVIKHSSILGQLDASGALDRLRDQETALSTLEKAFNNFLQRTDAVNVPLISNIKDVLGDYFARRPPFSTKKKAEFPDAISIASIRQWCKQADATAYVVSDDPDLKACCPDDGPLFHVESIAEIISRATVSHELRERLERALAASEDFHAALADAIKGSDVEFTRSSGIVSARITDVLDTSLNRIEVFEQRGQTLTCQAEIEASLDLKIDVELERRYAPPSAYDEVPWVYEAPDWERHTLSRTKVDYAYPEVIVRFDQSSGAIELESMTLYHTVRIDSQDLRL